MESWARSRSEFGATKENNRPNVVWGLRADQSLLRTHTASVESLERNSKRHDVDLATDAEMQTTSGDHLLRG